MKDCIFCQVIRGEISGKIIDQNDQVIVILSLQNYPLIITKKHLENIYQMDEQTGEAVMSESIKIARAVKKGLGADGVKIIQNNEAASGQEIFHYHMHIKPRYATDSVNAHVAGKDSTEEDKNSTLDKIKAALE